MTDQNRGGPSSGGRGPGGDRRDGRPGGNGPGGNRGGGKGGFGKGPAKAPRAETYESLKELTRGADFRIDKFVVAEKGTHRTVKTEYRLTREGLQGVKGFDRLVDAQAAAIEPLPEPETEVVEAAAEPVVEAAAEPPEPAAEHPPEAAEG
jgi:hypothetical protein